MAVTTLSLVVVGVTFVKAQQPQILPASDGTWALAASPAIDGNASSTLFGFKKCWPSSLSPYPYIGSSIASTFLFFPFFFRDDTQMYFIFFLFFTMV